MRIRSTTLSLLLALILTSCNTTANKEIVISRTYTVVIPPEELSMGCKLVSLPDPENLTNGELSDLIVKLANMNQKCVVSIQAIKSYLARAKAKIEEPK